MLATFLTINWLVHCCTCYADVQIFSNSLTTFWIQQFLFKLVINDSLNGALYIIELRLPSILPLLLGHSRQFVGDQVFYMRLPLIGDHVLILIFRALDVMTFNVDRHFFVNCSGHSLPCPNAPLVQHHFSGTYCSTVIGVIPCYLEYWVVPRTKCSLKARLWQNHVWVQTYRAFRCLNLRKLSKGASWSLACLYRRVATSEEQYETIVSCE